jgi:chromosome segregation ATPase
MKKAIGLALGLVLILLLSVSCGIPQDKYDKATSDLAAAQVQIQTMETQLTGKTAELSARDSDLTAAQTQITQLQEDLTANDTQLKTATDKLAKAKSEIEVLNAIFLPSITGELNQMTQGEIANLFLGWRDKINAIGDSALTAKFQAIIDSQDSEAATMAFFQYLLEDIANTLK